MVDRSPIERHATLPRWPLAAVLILALALVAIRIPSGREGVQDESVSELPAPATPLPEPQAYDLVWVPSDNTTIAVVGEGNHSLMAIRRYGPLDPIYASSVAVRSFDPIEPPNVVDVTPDGLAITWDGDAVSLWAPSDDITDRIAGGVTAAPILSPDGRLLAVAVDTAVFIYDLSNAVPGTTPADIAVSGVSDIRFDAVHWSPDARILGAAGTDEWVLFDVASGVAEARGEGRLLAVGGVFLPRVAVQIEDDLELRTVDGTIQRTWTDILPADPGALVVRGQFSPDTQFLAIQTARPDSPGVWILDIRGRGEFPVGSRPGIGIVRALSWSGDGRALYWLDGRQLVAWLASTRQTVLVTERDDTSDFPDRINGIRVYDQALVPTGTFSDRPAAPPAPPSVMADGAVLTQFDSSVVVERTIIDAPPGLALAGGASVVTGDEQRWGAEFAEGRISFESGPEWTFTDGEFAWVDGTSLTSLAGQFVWLADGDLYSEASFPEPLITADQLSPGRIMAVVGLRDSLVVTFQDAGNVTATLWQIPGWSDALSHPFLVNRGAVLPSSPFTLNVVWRPAGEFRMVRNLQQDAFAVTANPDQGGTFGQILFYPELDVSSVCGVQLGACQGPFIAGVPLTFSPEGHWVLTERSGSNTAVSTRGRGVIPLGQDTAFWQPLLTNQPGDGG